MKNQYNRIISKAVYVALLVFLLGSLVSAADYLPHKQSTDLSFTVTSNNATECNVSSITNSVNSVYFINQIMSKSGKTFSITINSNNFTSLGNYCLDIICTDSINFETGTICRSVTNGGENITSNQGYIILGQMGMIALFLIISFSFDKAKWKIRTLFFMASIFMGIILLNSIRIISGGSTSLTSMGNVGLILGIVILAFMFLFMLINYTIEVFRYFKDKSKMRFEANEAY